MHAFGFVLVRSGSKGIPDKNIQNVAGKPLLYWILKASFDSRSLSRVYVSSDSDGYLEIAKTLFPEVICLQRPREYAGDKSTESEALIYHLTHLLADGQISNDDIIVRLHATSPLQTPQDIDKTVASLRDNPMATSSVFVKKTSVQPEKLLRIEQRDCEELLVSNLTNTCEGVTPVNRQNYTTLYQRANIIASKAKSILSSGSLTGSYCIPVLGTGIHIDIDSAEDLCLASLVLNNMLK